MPLPMTRREIMTSLIALLGLTGTQILVGCGQTTTPASGDLTATSSSVGHTHQFTITAAELASPVAINRNTTSTDHSHVVSLTAVDVSRIAGGTAVSATTATTNGHTHSFTFQKV